MAIRVLTRPSLNHLFKTIYFSTHSKPQIVEFTHNKNFISLSKLLHSHGLPSSQLPHFLNKNRFLLHYTPSKVEKSIKILLSINPSTQFLTSIINSCPGVLDHEFMKKWEKGNAQTSLSCFTLNSIRNVLEVCRKFDMNPDDFSRFLECMTRLEFSTNTVDKVLDGFPTVILMNEDKIRGKVEFLLTHIGIERKDVGSLVGLFPGVLAFGVENKLKPLLEEFRGLGFSLDLVRKEVLRDPMVLGLEIGELSYCLKMLRSLKCRVAIREDIFRLGAFRAAYEVKLRVDCLRKHGLISRDAYTVLWKEPRAILYDVEDIEKKIDFAVHTMKYDIICLVDVPKYLGMNFEKQIVPRYNVINYLRSKGGLGDEVGLRELIKPSRLSFYNLYVKPYPECEKMYGRFTKDGEEAKTRHPIGMWKLFKPQTSPMTNEDVSNIKSYVQSLGQVESSEYFP